MELTDDRRLGTALLGESEREIVVVAGPIPDLFSGVGTVVDGMRAIE
jgi:hypothetical protein